MRKMTFKEFRKLLSSMEKHIWDMYNLGYSLDEIIEDLGIGKRMYHRLWESITLKGRKFFEKDS